jgi:alpha-N-acetylglucosamine transferase
MLRKRSDTFFLVLAIILCFALYYVQYINPHIYVSIASGVSDYNPLTDHNQNNESSTSQSPQSEIPTEQHAHHANHTVPVPKKGKRYAYATFLSAGRNELEIEHLYITAVRTLAYQLLIHPETKTKKDIPFIVMVPPHVPVDVRTQLEDEGVQVIAVENLFPESWEASPGERRWIDQYTKLRLFELTQFDRIAYMDSDMLVTRCLDDLFDEPEITTVLHTKDNPDQIKEDEAGMPSTYVLAGVVDNWGTGGHPAEIKPESDLNGGFLVLRPDQELFDYYKSVLELDGRVYKGFMEMSLLNYAHRGDGNMPWKALSPGRWNSNWPTEGDVERGCATLHDKFWDKGNAWWIDRKLVEMWWRIQGQMEGYWLAKSEYWLS